MAIALMRRGGSLRLAHLAALGAICFAVGASPPPADAASDQRDPYARAADLQKAADNGDPDAQLRIGELFEFGSGDLPQDYRRAAEWYQKAAVNTGTRAKAAYRLALIAASGSPEYRRDLVEAYKWAVLAAENEGVFGSLAADLKAQLAKVITPAQQEAAQKLARAWKQPPPVQDAGGCPGWPFPNLPCRDRPPPQPPGGPPGPLPPQGGNPRVTIDAIAATMEHVPCPPGRSESNAANVTPLCRSLTRLNEIRHAGLLLDDGLRLRLMDGKTELREGDEIKIEIGAPAYPVDLRIDYFSLDGKVLHLSPAARQPAPKLAPDETRVFSQGADGETWTVGGAPFGTEMVTAVATPRPLNLGGPRKDVEEAADYLRDLGTALDRIGAIPGTPSRVATLLVKTGRR
jgi:hypothetical protein